MKRKVLSIILAVCMIFGLSFDGYASFGPFLITFEANDNTDFPASGIPAPMVKTNNVPMFLPTTIPTRPGFEFLGWATTNGAREPNYKIEDIMLAVQRGTPQFTDNADLTLYAVWQTTMFTVTYNANGGTGIPAPQTKFQNTPLRLSGMKPTRDRHEFIGWGIAANSTIASFQPSDFYFANANIELFAMWRPLYIVRFDPAGGAVVPPEALVGTGGVYTLQTFPVPLRANHTFLGWFTAANGGELVTPDTVFSRDTTIFARWAGLYTITFNVSGGAALSPATAETKTDGKLTSLPTPARTGHNFVGWFTQAAGGTEVTLDTVFTANTTIFARWSEGFVITLNPTDGTVNPTWKLTKNDGKLDVIPIPTRTGFSFVGWFTQAAGGTEITTETVFTRDTEIFARWSSFVAANSSVNAKRDEIAAAAEKNDGTVITVVMGPGATSVSKEILAIIMGKNIGLELDFGNNGKLLINGRGVVGADGNEDLNLSLQYLTSANPPIPDYNIPRHAIEAFGAPVHQVKIGAKNTEIRDSFLTLYPGREHAGKYAFLCSFNAASGKFEPVSAFPSIRGSDGGADFLVGRTGDYVLMVRQKYDVTGTGSVTANDALTVLRAVAGRTALDRLQTFLITGSLDGVPNARHALDILKIVIGDMTGN